MARKKASEQGDTQKEILEAAFALFGRDGFDGVSMGAISKEASITKAALYWHYDGKAQLYVECLERLYAIMTEYVFARMERAATPGESLLGLFQGAWEMLQDPRIRGGVAGYWLDAATADLDAAGEVQRAFEARSLVILSHTIQQAIDAGELDLGISVDAMARAVVSTLEAVILPARRVSRDRNTQLVRSLAYTFFKAHATRPELVERALELGELEG